MKRHLVVVLLLIGAFIPLTARAQTRAQLINQLQQLIVQLQAQLRVLQMQTPRPTSVPVFPSVSDDNHQVSNQTSSLQDNSILSISQIKRLNCGGCYGESVLGINPNDDNYGYLLGNNGNLVQTNDGWITSQIFDINQLTNPLIKEFYVDPKFSFTNDGKLVISSLFGQRENTGNVAQVTGGIYQSYRRNISRCCP